MFEEVSDGIFFYVFEEKNMELVVFQSLYVRKYSYLCVWGVLCLLLYVVEYMSHGFSLTAASLLSFYFLSAVMLIIHDFKISRLITF